MLVWLVTAGTVLYEPWMTAVSGQTLGKKMVGIKAVRSDNGQPPGWGKSLGHWAIPVIASVLAGIGGLMVYLSTTWGLQRKGWHDLAAGTLVVKA